MKQNRSQRTSIGSVAVAAMAALLTLSGCNERDGVGFIAKVNHYEDPPLEFIVTGTASKSLNPTEKWADFVYSMPRIGWVSVPQKLEVVEGNGSNNFATVEISHTLCVYKAQSSVREAIGSQNVSEIEAGLQYILQGCMNKSGALVYGSFEVRAYRGESVRIHVVDSDPGALKTQVKATFFMHE